MVNVRWKRILRPWLWVLAGAVFVGVLVFVLVLALHPSLLIGSPPIGKPPTGLSVADKLKAQNDVRTTLVQALAGLAVAGGLVFTYRTYRQNRAEQDRTYERELYAKAVEQLGHEKAPVRLGALYSLERLAEDKPERRQIIVDVICAYLRMPFSPTAPAAKPKPEATEEPAAETERRTEWTGDTWQQERQVRLTAQSILAEHLRNDRTRDKRSTDPPGPRFWPGIRLNLAGATLIEFQIQDGVVAAADFRGATFAGAAWLGQTTFTDSAEFGGATFVGGAGFGGATFTGTAGFDRTTFTGRVHFGGAIFKGNTWFDEAIFADGAWFALATFTAGASFPKAAFAGDVAFTGAKFARAAEFDGATFASAAWFIGATFTGNARFGGATFAGDTAFGGATFAGDAGFAGATFTGAAGFGGATFAGDAGFIAATFAGAAWFIEATFTGAAGFGGAKFDGGEGSLSFDRSRVVSSQAKHIWPTGWCLGPDGSDGHTVVRADDGPETGPKPEAPPAAGTAEGA